MTLAPTKPPSLTIDWDAYGELMEDSDLNDEQKRELTPLTAGWSKGKYKKYPYYLCRQKGCAQYGKSIARNKIEGEFAELLADMQPSETLLKLLSHMFQDAWDQRQVQQNAINKAFKREAMAIDKRIDELLDRILETTNQRVIDAYEKKIDSLEIEKLVLLEKAQKSSSQQYTYRELFELSMKFLSSPYKLWASGKLELQRLVLRLAFSEAIPYQRGEGFLNTKKSHIFNMLEIFSVRKEKWCCKRELNSRPLPYQGSALPLSYCSEPLFGSDDDHLMRAVFCIPIWIMQERF